MNHPPHEPVLWSYDALLPPDMALKAEQTGAAKAALGTGTTLGLAFLAGAFIALGGVFYLTVVAGAQGAPWGLVRLAGGVAFSLGLILVVVGGAELFTGNNLIVMAWASRRVSTWDLLRNWGLVYLGNFAGAASTAGLVYLSGHYALAGGAVGKGLLVAAQAKCSYGLVQAVALGALCNVLVCLAIWLCFSARTTTDKVLAIVLPISAFVAAGFEHSVANMFFLPLALIIKAGAPDAFWATTGLDPAGLAGLTWHGFWWRNLLPVTLGNILGGSVMVGLVYWFIYIRKRA